MTSDDQSPALRTLPAVLAERARATPHEPWLFHREGWDWCWRSWSRVADQVARSVPVLRRLAAGGSVVAYRQRQHPDAITCGLSIQAAGRIAMPLRGDLRDPAPPPGDAWAEIEGATGQEPAPGLERVVLPPALSALERTKPRPLVLGPESAAGAVHLPGLGELAPPASIRAAERLDGLLRPAARRDVVCASPQLDPPATRLLEAWTLVRGAAWVLEPAATAFLETVLWARPTVVWGLPGEIQQLAMRMESRKRRRQSRLSQVVVAGEGEIDPQPWGELGVEIVTLGEDPLKG